MPLPAAATSPLSSLFAERIAQKRLALPVLPGVATEVLALCQSDATDAAKLSAAIHRDPTLASNVLRVANSAAHAGNVPCASLQQAVGRLGLQLVTEIAMAVAVRGRLFANPTVATLLQRLWRHAVLSGFFAKEIARLRRRNVEIAFLCGLLHDVGEAVLLADLEHVPPAARAPLPETAAAIREQHVAAGTLLAAEWRLPEPIAEAIRCHHDPATAPKFADLAMTVQLADLLAHTAAPDLLGDTQPVEPLRQHPLLVGLNLYSDQFEALLARMPAAQQCAEGLA